MELKLLSWSEKKAASKVLQKKFKSKKKQHVALWSLKAWKKCPQPVLLKERLAPFFHALIASGLKLVPGKKTLPDAKNKTVYFQCHTKER